MKLFHLVLILAFFWLPNLPASTANAARRGNAAAAKAPEPALDFEALGAGQNYHEGTFSLGWSFTAKRDCLVASLGFYDDLKDGLRQSHPVGLYDYETEQLLATTTVVPSDPLVGFFRYHPIQPVRLITGRKYVLQSVNYDESYAIFVSPVSLSPFISWDAYAFTQSQSDQLRFPASFSPNVLYGDFGPNAMLEELGSVLSATNVTPDRGGNTGQIGVQILGTGFPNESVTVSLRGAGKQDIVSTSAVVRSDGIIDSNFNLQGASTGVRDVVVSFSGGNSTTLSAGFTVEKGRAPEIWLEVLTRPQVALGRRTKVTVVVGNRGNIDAYVVPLWVGGVPKGAKWELEVPLFEFDPEAGGSLIERSQIPLHIDRENDQLIPLLLPVIPAGSTRTVTLSIIPTERNPISIESWTSPPLIDSVDTGSIRVSDLTLDTASQCFAAIINYAWPKVIGLLPGVECTRAIQAALLSRSLTLVQLVRSAADKSLQFRDLALSFLSFVVDGAAVGLSCANETNVPSKAIRLGLAIAELIVDADGINTVVSECSALRMTNPSPPLRGPGIDVVASADPNEIVGPIGSGPVRYITSANPLPYTIFFENLPSATAPAQEVFVSGQLDPGLMDLSTFSLGRVTFGDRTLTPPVGLKEWDTRVDLRPEKPLLVHVHARLDVNTGALSWIFRSIDPATGDLPEDPLLGFLPPNRNQPEGEGSVFFTVKPKVGLPDGTRVENGARIVFDLNAPIDTNLWSNTFDSTPPTSRVTSAVPTAGKYEVRWQGEDNVSGVRSYTVYVSDNGGPFEPRLQTADTSAPFTAEFGHAYAFYTIARDNAGNGEAPPIAPDLVLHAPDLNVDYLLSLVTSYRSSGEISKNAVAKQLQSQLSAIKKALAKGKRSVALRGLAHFVKVVGKARGKTIGIAAAEDLLSTAELLAAQLSPAARSQPASPLPATTSCRCGSESGLTGGLMLSNPMLRR